MRRNKEQIEARIKEIHSYLLCHNMADMSKSEFWRSTNELHVLGIISENNVVKSYRVGNYMDGYKLMK
ncbi:hypothetical protein [Dysgonomonas macrotermitis]|uniref:Uncharacterized protein n=1 Tax=Dysgonomonas macrotermitis TaxID=1346286 RepID=A0A1M5IXP2_9BACT|nr:hypothetical protein [Dysgonomonas macrotermitis]SHG33092.1 hypothetical protein SAMN05444362_12152 [Dysgonomonas macrotermitis]